MSFINGDKGRELALKMFDAAWPEDDSEGCGILMEYSPCDDDAEPRRELQSGDSTLRSVCLYSASLGEITYWAISLAGAYGFSAGNTYVFSDPVEAFALFDSVSHGINHCLVPLEAAK